MVSVHRPLDGSYFTPQNCLLPLPRSPHLLFLYLADAIIIIHFGFVIFVIAGGLLLLRWPRVIWLHLPAILWGALVEFLHLVCPLTYLEDWLRERAGVAAYHGDFVEHYLMPILYPAHLTAHIQIFLGGLVVIINVIIYGWWILRHKHRFRHAQTEKQ